MLESFFSEIQYFCRTKKKVTKRFTKYLSIYYIQSNNMKSFKSVKRVKNSFKKILNKKNTLLKENKYILNKISENLLNEDFSNFEAYNKILKYNLFDEEYYLKQCEFKPETDSLLHYIYIGYLYDYNPCEMFDTKFYKEFNNNISNENPLVYFVEKGINEGIIKINKDIWQPLAINKYEIYEAIGKFDEYGLNEDKRDDSVIISLTSYPKRINEVVYTIHSLLNQDWKADKIILWLAEKEFPKHEENLPEDLLRLKQYGLTIKWCDSLKSYKKLIPSLQEYPDSLIITADDDLYYPKEWLRKLYEHHKNYPNDIVTHRARKIRFKDCELRNYKEWTVCENEEDASFLNFFTTGGGTLFPPNSLSKTVYQTKMYDKLCPTGDDIWFWAMAVLNNTKIRVVKNNICDITYVNPARDIVFNKDTLWSYNETHNDEQFKLLLEEFPNIKEKILDEYKNINLQK